MSKCDFCDRPYQYYGSAQVVLYCDSVTCREKASEIEAKFLDALLGDEEGE